MPSTANTNGRREPRRNSACGSRTLGVWKSGEETDAEGAPSGAASNTGAAGGAAIPYGDGAAPKGAPGCTNGDDAGGGANGEAAGWPPKGDDGGAPPNGDDAPASGEDAGGVNGLKVSAGDEGADANASLMDADRALASSAVAG